MRLDELTLADVGNVTVRINCGGADIVGPLLGMNIAYDYETMLDYYGREEWSVPTRAHISVQVGPWSASDLPGDTSVEVTR